MFFTLEEAEEILPEVTRLMREIRRTHNAILKKTNTNKEDVEIRDETDNICVTYSFIEGDKEIDSLISKVNSKIALLEHAGILIRSIDEGSVEFPSIFQDKEIYYVHRIGDKHIKHWYSEDDGFKKKNKILDLSNKIR